MTAIPCSYPWISKTVDVASTYGMYPREIAGFVQHAIGSDGTVELFEMFDDGPAVHIVISLRGMPRKLRLMALLSEDGIVREKPGFVTTRPYYTLRVCHYEGDEPTSLPLKRLMTDITKVVTGFATKLEGAFAAAPRNKEEWPSFSGPDDIPTTPKHDPAVA